MDSLPIAVRVYRHAVAAGDGVLAGLLAARLLRRDVAAFPPPPADAAARAVDVLARHLGLRPPRH